MERHGAESGGWVDRMTSFETENQCMYNYNKALSSLI